MVPSQKIYSLFPNLEQKIKGQTPFFFSDFDGTLAPIRRDPAKVVLSIRARTLLNALTLRMPVAIISGRPLTYLHKIIDRPKIVLAGNHGLEIDIPGDKKWPSTRFCHPEAIASKKKIHQLAGKLQHGFSGTRGVLIEDKGLTLTLHYRSVLPALHEAVFKTFNEIVQPFQDGNRISVSRGKMCLEVRPDIDWGKADAMQWILNLYQKRCDGMAFFPVYMGDDETDKPAIALAHKKGISLFKDDGRGIARRVPNVEATYHVASHEEIIRFMQYLISLNHLDSGSNK